MAPGADVVVVVDVLSFTTTVSVALDAGATVLPLPPSADGAGFARGRAAVLAAGRSRPGDGQVSLSPASMRAAARAGQRIVLASPNGSTISHHLAGESVCVAGCLRNARAVAGWVARPGAGSVAVLAAGERWSDGSLRPAVEDLWGAGAVVAGLYDRGWHDLSVEAQVARAAYLAVIGRLQESLLDCASGRELAASGFADDVRVAAELDESTVVPVLREGAYVDGTRRA